MPAKWLSKEQSEKVLENGFYGRMATSVDDRPYITPVNYAYHQGKIFIHCNVRGRKLDNIAKNPQVCFEVSETHKLVKDKKPCGFGVRFSSVLVFGRARLVEELDQKMEATMVIVKKYAGDFICDPIPQKQLKSIAIIEITIDELTGKQNVDPQDL